MTLQGGSRGLKAICAGRRVDYGWPKVPKQSTLVRGSAGNACEGSLGHPLDSSYPGVRRSALPSGSRRPGGEISSAELDPEDELSEAHVLGREGLEVDTQ